MRQAGWNASPEAAQSQCDAGNGSPDIGIDSRCLPNRHALPVIDGLKRLSARNLPIAKMPIVFQ
jgi:hypothetical protein